MPLGHSTQRQLKTGLPHETMSEVMWLLYGCGSTSFEVSEEWGRKQSCFLVIVSYCYDTLEKTEGSGMKQEVAGCTSCIRCVTTIE